MPRAALAALLALFLAGTAAGHTDHVFPAPAEPLALDDAQRAVLAQHPVVRVAVKADWPPLEFTDEAGRFQGLIADYLATLEQKLGIRLEPVVYPRWTEALDAFERGEVQMLSGLGRTPEREASMRFTDPFLKLSIGILVRREEGFVERLSDLPAGRRLAFLAGSAPMLGVAAANPHLIAVPVATVEDTFAAVSAGQADVTLAPLIVAYHLLNARGYSNLRVAANFEAIDQRISMALAPSLAALVAPLNAALASLTTAEHDALRARWTGAQLERGISRRALISWAVVALLLLALLGFWVVQLSRAGRKSRALLARAEAAEARTLAMMRSSPALFWAIRIDHGQPAQVVFYRNAIADKVGLDEREVPLDTLLARMAPDDAERFRTLMATQAHHPQPVSFEHRQFSTDGPRAGWMLVRMVPRTTPTGIVWQGCSVDVSERKKLESALERSRNQLQGLAAGVPGALWQFRREADGYQHYSFMSDGIVSITGRTPEETNQLMKDKSFVSVHPEDLPILQGLMQRLTERPGIEEARYRLRHRDGSFRWVQVAARGMPPEPDGALVWNGITLDATRMQEVEEVLREEQQRLREVTGALSIALWRIRRAPGGGYRFDYVSEGIRAITGGEPAAIVSGEAEPFGAVDAADQQRLVAALEATAATGEPMDIELSTRAATGEVIRVQARAEVRHDEGEPVWTGMVVNVSDRHRMQNALDDAHERLAGITNSFPGAIWQMERDPGGIERFTYMSENITGITGRPAADALNRPGLPFDVMLEEDRPRVRAALEAAASSGGNTRVDYRLRHANGRPRWVTTSFVCRRKPDGTLTWSGVLTDAEEPKRIEAELRAAQGQAEAASEAKTRFLASMSHEIRTPMNAVIGLAHLAMTTATDPEQAARIGKIHTAGRALLKLLNDILEYARLDAGKVAAVESAFTLAEIEEALELFCAPIAEAKALAFRIERAAGLASRWRGDATRLQQVLLNLINNGIKFSDTGAVTLAIAPRAGPADGLVFEVRDTGVGMSPAELARVFEPFEQATGETERRHGGSGLGLTISKALVETLGGQISVRSTPGQGTSFRVELPLQRLPEATLLAPVLTSAAEERLERLADQVGRQQSAAARATLQALRLLLVPSGQAGELYVLERQLSEFDFAAAAVELSRVRRVLQPRG